MDFRVSVKLSWLESRGKALQYLMKDAQNFCESKFILLSNIEDPFLY